MMPNKILSSNYSTLRSNLRKYLDATSDSVIVINRPDDKDVVMITLDEYNNLIENAYIRADRKSYDRLLRSIDRAEKGDLLKISLNDKLENFVEES
jgi:antitoxin YefM